MKNIRQRFTGMRFIAPALAATFAVGGAIGFTSHRQPQSLIPAASAGAMKRVPVNRCRMFFIILLLLILTTQSVRKPCQGRRPL